VLYNKDKKGTIILSHYRSGGTQLLSTLWLAIGEKNSTKLGEWNGTDVDDYYKSGKVIDESEKFYNWLENSDNNQLNKISGKYTLTLLNNPYSITKFYLKGMFTKLKDDYNIVVLERKNKVNCILSLELWELFIQTGIFGKGYESWDKETMLEFHNLILKKPLVLHNPHDTLKNFTLDIHLLKKIQQEFDFPKIYYEDFEYDRNYLVSWFEDIDEEHIKFVAERCEQKIPYVYKNYIDYYDDVTKDIIKEWKLNEL